MLTDDWDWLGRGDIVPRTPIILPISSVEVFLDDLLPPRQSVPTAHGRIIADQMTFVTFCARPALHDNSPWIVALIRSDAAPSDCC